MKKLQQPACQPPSQKSACQEQPSSGLRGNGTPINCCPASSTPTLRLQNSGRHGRSTFLALIKCRSLGLMRKMSTEATHSPCSAPSTAPLACPGLGTPALPVWGVSPAAVPAIPLAGQREKLHHRRGRKRTSTRSSNQQQGRGQGGQAGRKGTCQQTLKGEKEGVRGTKKGMQLFPSPGSPESSTTTNVPQIFHISASLSLALGIRMDHTQRGGGQLFPKQC